MKAYSQDLRQRILQTVDEGKTQAQAACLLKVSETTVKRYVRQRRERGHVRPKPIPGRPPTKRAPLEAQAGIKVSISTMSRAIQHLQWTRKKKYLKPVREKKRNAANGENTHKSWMRGNSSF